jgi:Fe-S cluster biogenesis protein NfuA
VVSAEEQSRMAQLIEAISAYLELYHQGKVELVNYDGETLKVHLGGACAGCSMSQWTLAMSIGQTVRHYFPDLKQVEAV